MASADGGQQEPGGSQLAVPDGPQVPGGGQQMPDPDLIIGTRKAFERNQPYAYWKKQIDSEIIYVSNQGSEWAREDEVLVLRRDLSGTWTAFDTALIPGETLRCRQPVFRALGAADITQAGWHMWEMNYGGDEWQGSLWAETRV